MRVHDPPDSVFTILRNAHFNRFLKMCRHQEKPFPLLGSTMAMAEMYEHIAGQDVRVVLDGTGGDEVFGGYWDRYFGFAVRDAVRAGDQAWLNETAAANRDDDAIMSVMRDALRGAAPSETAAGRTPLLTEFGQPIVAQAPVLDPLDGFKGSFTEALFADASVGRLNEWIWHNDRNSMMSSVEARSPLLDYRLIPFLASGYDRKFSGAWNKCELRRSYDRFTRLPTQWRREKQGFRWVLSRFLTQNADAVLALVAASELLPIFVKRGAFIDRASKDENCLGSSEMARLVCIAGLEEVMKYSV